MELTTDSWEFHGTEFRGLAYLQVTRVENSRGDRETEKCPNRKFFMQY